MNTEALDTRAVTLDIRALEAMLVVISDHYQGLQVDPEEMKLARVATDLAVRIDGFFKNLPVGAEASRFCGVSGPLAASLESACDASTQAADEKDEDSMAKLVTRAAWLQAQALDLAKRLAADFQAAVPVRLAA